MLRPLAVYFCGLLVSEVSAAPISFPAASCPFYVSGPTSFCDEADIRNIRCAKRQDEQHCNLHHSTHRRVCILLQIIFAFA